jgi:hypothetical protein
METRERKEGGGRRRNKGRLEGVKSGATMATLREIGESGGEDGERKVNKVVRGRETKCRSLQYGGGRGRIFLVILKTADTHALRYTATQCREAQCSEAMCTTALTDMAQNTQINPIRSGSGLVWYGTVQCNTSSI